MQGSGAGERCRKIEKKKVRLENTGNAPTKYTEYCAVENLANFGIFAPRFFFAPRKNGLDANQPKI